MTAIINYHLVEHAMRKIVKTHGSIRFSALHKEVIESQFKRVTLSKKEVDHIKALIRRIPGYYPEEITTEKVSPGVTVYKWIKKEEEKK